MAQVPSLAYHWQKSGGWMPANGSRRALLGGRIPLLEEVLGVARGRLLVDIEVKVAGIEGQVIEAVRRMEMLHATLIMSFMAQVVSAVQTSAPEIPVGLLQEHGRLADALRVPILLPSVAAPSAELVEECRRYSIVVIPWTIRTGEEARMAVRLGTHGIIANDPRMTRRIVLGSVLGAAPPRPPARRVGRPCSLEAQHRRSD